MKTKVLSACFVMCLFLVGCSSSSGPLFKDIATIPDGKAIIYIYRPDDEKRTEFDVKCNGRSVCVLERGTYIPVFVLPGKVELTSSVRFKLFATGILDEAIGGASECVFKAELGRIYYVECLADQMEGQKLSVSIVPENYGRIRIKGCHLLENI